MTLMSRRRALMAQAASEPAHRLPVEYQEVEWIQSSGTQAIITNYKPQYAKLVDLTMAMDVLLPSSSTASTAMIASFSSWSGQWVGLMTNSKIGLGNSIGFSNVINSNKNRITMTWDAFYGYAHCGAETIQRITNNDRALQFSLFANHTKEYWSTARIFYAQILDGGDVVLELIPCYRIADDVIGMFETVSGTFYTNEGTGVFTKGDNV